MKRIIVVSDTHGVLRLNSGSCGRRRFDQEITVAMMTVGNGDIHVEKAVIPHEKGRT